MAKKKKKFDYRNLILFAVSCFFSFVILEIALRIIFPDSSNVFSKDYQSKEFLMEMPYWKVWHYPNNNVVHGKDCFEKTYSSNAFGMKGPALEEGKPRIALVGDSFIEGFGNNNNGSINHFMDSLLLDQYEVLNMGTSGGFGTVHQLAQYENFTRFFKPDVVVVFFLNYNDLYDNVNAVSEGLLTEDLAFNYPKATSLEDVTKVLNAKTSIPKEIKQDDSFMTTKLLFKGGRWIMSYIQMASNAKLFDFRTAIAQMYAPEQTETIKKGYEITKKSLQRLHELTQQDSAQLVVVNIADPFQVDPTWLSISGSRIDQELDATYPNKQIANICENLGISYLDLYPSVMKHIEENQLGFPYLSHNCDRHYAEKGHLLNAQLVTKYLREKGMVN